MNYLWGSMILIGIIYGTVTGHLEEVSEAAIQSSKEAVSLCVVMAGVTALWVGMMRIAEKSGLLEAMEQRMQPVLNFLFPEIPGNHPSRKSIATNLLANILGLGWAATPAGLKAMEELSDLEEERRMFYVAMTRAKSRLHIFFLKERYGRPMVMSRFVGEILVDRNAVKPGMRVQHQTYGAGVIKEVTDKAIVIRFDKIRQEKKLDIQFCLTNQLLKIQS